MTQITRVPIGLQDFLGTQAQGSNPSELGQVVIPSVDMGQFLAVNSEYWANESGLFTASTSLYITVPDGETWLLKSFGVESDGGGAGGNYLASSYLDRMPNSDAPPGRHPIMDMFSFTATPATLKQTNVTHFPDGIVCFPGTRVETFFQVTAGANFTPIIWARYLRLRT